MRIKRKKIVIFLVLFVLLTILVYFVAAGLSTRPAQVIQELCLLNLRDHIFVEVDKQWKLQGGTECLLEIPFFKERSPKVFVEVNQLNKIEKETGIIVFNTSYEEDGQDWIAIYIGRDFASKIKGHLALLKNREINRIRELDIMIKNANNLKYYKVNE